MARHWTPEERQRQAALIKNWSPWNKSTGPRTYEGKCNSAENSLKHGLRSAEFIAEGKRVNAVIRQAKEYLLKAKAFVHG